jgi:hypothetical protein
MPRACLFLMAAGVVGAYGWFRLGQGRLHSFEYVCTWLSALSVLMALLGLSVWLQVRSQTTRPWPARASGILVALSIFTCLYLLAQGACGWLNSREEARITRDGTHSEGTSYRSSRILGHTPRPNVTSGARLTADGEVIFDYTYHTDAFRRRITPDSLSDRTRERAVVFFGDSYTFGEGVNDDETLPNQVARLRPDVAVYNYAFSGYGPNHMLARLESMNTRAEVPEPRVVGVYVFIPNHVRRVIGAFSVIAWSRHSPYYVMGEDGLPMRLGSFQGERSRLTGCYDFLKGDQVLKYFALDFPPKLTNGHHALTEAIIAQAAERFSAQFESDEFYVVLYPRSPEDEFPARETGKRLSARGLRVLDYTDLLPEPAETHFFLPYDSHPRASAHALVAAQLAADLGISTSLKTP